MAIERFKKPGCESGVSPLPGKGRMAPEGLAYLESWV
jgi:hypothetical protein